MVARADKGNITVIMNQEVYDSKILNLLTDTSTYKPISKAMTQIMAEERKVIDDITGNFLRTYNGTIPKTYGLPKIHKPSCPLRPIVSYTPSDLVIKQIGKKWGSPKIHTSIPQYEFIKGIELIRVTFPTTFPINKYTDYLWAHLSPSLYQKLC